MTFAELAKEISKDKRIGVSKRQALCVLLLAFRYIMEEMAVGGAGSGIRINGFGYLSIKARKVPKTFLEMGWAHKLPETAIYIHFTPYDQFKWVVKGWKDIDDVSIAGYSLKTLEHANAKNHKVEGVEPRKDPIQYSSGKMVLTRDAISVKAKEMARRKAEEKEKAKKKEKLNLESRLPKRS